jgi:fido (protein-threonine AMPylation protein)
MEETEFKLLNWRGDSSLAERMCTDILVMQDFELVDPQSPLGGPDGTKDIVCEKGGWKYIAAVFFPPFPKGYTSIRSKFASDFKGVKKNNVDGIIFFTNQNLTPTNKKNLRAIAESQKSKFIIFDNEAIRALLDSALGFPVRLQYLKIPLNKAEQLAFFSKQNNRLPQLFDLYSKGIVKALSERIDECYQISEIRNEKYDEFYSFAESTMAQIKELSPKSDKTNLTFPSSIGFTTEQMDSANLKLIHKIMLYESGSKELGLFRTHQVWIGTLDSKPDKATYLPPKPEEVGTLTEKLLENWRTAYGEIKKSKDKDFILTKIANFHNDFLAIHPFLDGNGRVARFILNQQVNELLGIQRHIIIEDRPSYFESLTQAQNGNIKPLLDILTQAIYGSDAIK